MKNKRMAGGGGGENNRKKRKTSDEERERKKIPPRPQSVELSETLNSRKRPTELRCYCFSFLSKPSINVCVRAWTTY